MKCNLAPLYERIIVRLQFDKGQTLPAADQLANRWADVIKFCQDIGVYNFIVLNELDYEYWNDSWWPQPRAQYMANLATQIRAKANPSKPLYLGFPGPSAQSSAGSTQWENYWTLYKDTINRHYDNISLHTYGHSLQQLKDDTWNQATYIRNLFPGKAQRFTEYGIPIGDYGGNRENRAKDYVKYVNWVRSGWQDYILALHLIFSPKSDYKDYELTPAEAAILTNGVGCVGQT